MPTTNRAGIFDLCNNKASLIAQLVKKKKKKKNLSAMQETQVRSLGQENPLKEVATHCSILAWRIPWTGEPGGLQPMGSQESDIT